MVDEILAADPSLKHTKIPMSKCARSTFPTRSQLSVLFAAKNSYPGLLSYLEEHKMWKKGMAFVERYDFHFKQIEYFAGFEEDTHNALSEIMTMAQPKYLKEY